MDIQIGRMIDREIDRQISYVCRQIKRDRQEGDKIDRWTGIQMDRQGCRQGGEIDRVAGGQMCIQIDRPRDRLNYMFNCWIGSQVDREID